MAVYRVDRYARTFYGPNPEVPSFDEREFWAYSVGYEGIFITWDLPTGEYEAFRLVGSVWGFPTHPDDGRIIVETESAPASAVDEDTIPGRFHYYAIFLKINGVWVRAGTASTLHIHDWEMTKWVTDLTPYHYKLLRGNHLTLYADENEQLLRFLGVIGYGLDRLRTSLNAALHSRDVATTHISTVAHIAYSLGAEIPEGITPTQMRLITLNSAYLASERGHPDTMLYFARAATGWDMDLRMSYNLVPSYDMAEQINPVPPQWDASVRYKIGDLVTVDGFLYRCVQPAYGMDEAPPGNGSNNSWWEVYTVVQGDTPAYDQQLKTTHGWSGVSHTQGVSNSQVVPRIVRGVPHPLDPDKRDANALTIHNTSSTTATCSLFSLPLETGDSLVAVKYGIPLPRVFTYDHTASYKPGDLVNYLGQVYKCVRAAQGHRPSQHPERWERNSIDERLRITVSAYTHQPHGTSQATAQVTPYVTWYDELGREIGTVVAGPSTRVLDTFNTYPGSDALAPLGGRNTDEGGKTWSDVVPGFIRDSYLDGVARPADPDASRNLSVIDYGSANATVAATFATEPRGNKKQALILRLSDENNYIRATRTALERVSSGTVITLATYASPVVDGDRLTVRVTGNNYTVWRNNVQVATATESFNNTATKFGIAVED